MTTELQELGTNVEGPVKNTYPFSDKCLFFFDPAGNHYAVYTPSAPTKNANGAIGRMAGLKASKDQPALAKQSSARHFASQDPEITDEAYNSFVPLFPRVPYVLEEAVRGTLAATDHPKAATADPNMFFDNRFLQELESSGFVKELYGNK